MVHISEREQDLPEALIAELLDIAAERKDVISLGPGEPDFITPKPILDYASKILNKSTHYSASPGKTELREAIAKKLRKENKIKCDIDNIVVGAGSQEVLFSAFLATLDVSEQVIVPTPGYLGYIPAIELVNAVPVSVPLFEENDFELNPDDLKKIIDKKKTKVILINTPSNPTGTVFSKKVLEEVADIAIENDCYIFADEAYEKIVYDKKHISVGSLEGMEDHVVTFQSFSKTYAMTGFRVGYACGPEAVIRAITKSKHYVSLAPPHVSQFLAMKALTIPNSYINKMVSEYRERRNFLVKRLNKLGLTTPMPQGAFYAFSNVKHLTSSSLEFAKKILKEAKVAVVPGTDFGRDGEGYIRFSYATKLPLIKRAMDRIERFLK
ncbi:MAG: pyridoxal phosphate-dependent aminotransferase [Candidatus Nanoarchaeia archaeon]|nr:pyridoxal phosphate-dependent aminotransferase [Candidatus Nanoarchaeia archaeon]